MPMQKFVAGVGLNRNKTCETLTCLNDTTLIYSKKSRVGIHGSCFLGKRLFCCETAKVNFDTIINTVGGPNEKIRAKEFMKNVIVLPDDATAADTTPSAIFEKSHQTQFSPSKALPLGGKITQRSKIIFRFGDNIQALTVTANEGFVRSAKQQGINFVVFIHESRALSEQKQAFAEKISI